MRPWVVLVAATLLGLVVGIGLTVHESLVDREVFFPTDQLALEAEAQRQKKASTNAGPVKRPKVQVLGSAEYDFGSMELNSKRTHTFRVKNVGDAMLKLEIGRVTCKCTVSDVADRDFAPGEIADVKLEWTGKTVTSDPDFYQTAEIKTNDPDAKSIEFKIHGYVTENIRALPDALALGRVSSNDGTEAQFRLFAFLSDAVVIRETEFEDAEQSSYFGVAFSPLSPEDLKQEKGATGGLLATVTVKPGLPMGLIDQTLRIAAEVGKAVEIHVPIKGQVVGDIVLAAPQYEASLNLLRFGALPRNRSAKATIHMFVRGDYRHDTKFEVARVEPAGYLKVNIGPGQELNNGKAIKYDVTVEIPPGLSTRQ